MTKKICPNPMPWHEASQRLKDYARLHPCDPPEPPQPLVLSGWTYSNDVEKQKRWDQTIAWVEENGCIHIIADISGHDFYFVDEPTSYQVGPLGGPMYRPWDFTTKERPASDQIANYMQTLIQHWSGIVGDQIGNVTRPLKFTGKRARRLLVAADSSVNPPWGSWTERTKVEADRRTFTKFRAAVSQAISPHEVDHIDFEISNEWKIIAD